MKKTAVLSFAAVMLAGYAVASAYAENPLPFRLVQGDSMYPAVYAGDVILLGNTAVFAEVEKGDVIAYRCGNVQVCGNKILLHRVTNVYTIEGQRIFTMKGDNTVADSQPVSEEMFVGKMRLRISIAEKPFFLF